MEAKEIRYNSLSYLMTCVNRYIRVNNLNADGWQVISVGTGTAYDSWHYNITIQAPSGMEKTIRIPMYLDRQIDFDLHFVHEC